MSSPSKSDNRRHGDAFSFAASPQFQRRAPLRRQLSISLRFGVAPDNTLKPHVSGVQGGKWFPELTRKE